MKIFGKFLFLFATILIYSATLIYSSPTLAEGKIDNISTSSIGSNANIGQPIKASAKFLEALKLLDEKEYAKAYKLARSIKSNLERRTIQWAAIYYGNGEIDYNSVLRFAKDAPLFASPYLYKTRLEQALIKSDANYQQIISLLGGKMPNIIEAQIVLARSYIKDGQRARAGRIIKYIWINKFLDRKTEEEIYQQFGSLLTNEDHWKRAQNLLMNDRAKGVERIMSELSLAQKSLARARIAVSRKAKNAQYLLDRVDPSLRDNYIFHFANAQLARRAQKPKRAVAHLDKIKGNIPNSASALIWYERRLLVRMAIRLKQYKTAYKAAAGYQRGPEGRLVEANFHAGWVALNYLNDAKAALIHFEQQRSLSTLASTITQSNYWLGRALRALGDKEGAKEAFTRAAQYDKTYYGQLARAELGLKMVNIRPMPKWREYVPIFEKRELVRAIRLLAKYNRGSLAEPLIKRLAYSLQNGGEFILAARLAQSIDAHNIAILIADIANRRGFKLDLFNYPLDGISKNYKLAKIDRAAIYAIARQESRFDFDAVSRSGARGVMQLMPATAAETAKKIGIRYSQYKLNDPAYNILLGSTYLAKQMDKYDGSLVLAAAAYNAGAGNVDKWLKYYGDPREKNINIINWIETIPFVETRKYVQRIMANYMVYRARLGNNNGNIMQALRAIPY